MHEELLRLVKMIAMVITVLLGEAACRMSGPASQSTQPIAESAAKGTIRTAAATETGGVRYVRFEALSEVNGNPWTSIAELNLLGADGTPISRLAWRVSADSQEVSGEYAPATAAIDGDPNTFWHTQWQGTSPAPPHSLTIDLGAAQMLTAMRYLPRQAGINGRVAAWRLLTSTDGSAWNQVAQGSFPNTAAEQTVTLQATSTITGVQARFVRLQALSEINGGPWTSVGEFEVLDAAGSALPRTGWVATADSEETSGEFAPARLAIDGDPNTYWHTQWQDRTPPLPHALTIDLGAVRTIGGFHYWARRPGLNGRIAIWRFFTSLDGTQWNTTAEGQFARDVTDYVTLIPASKESSANPNAAPQLAPIANRSDSVAASVALSLSATDADGDMLSYSATGLPPGIVIAGSTGQISGVFTTSGTYSPTVQVSDGRGGLAQRSFSWIISPVAIQPPTTNSARLVRFEALSEVNGNPWSSIAELNLLDADGVRIPHSGWQITADSQEISGEYAPASAAIDGDPNTFWHSKWLGGSPPPPHWLTIDLGSTRAVTGLRYLPRQAGINGRVAAWRLLTSLDSSSWTQVAQGIFANSAAEQSASFVVATPPPAASIAASRNARTAAFASGPLVAGPAWSAGEAVGINAVRRLSSGHHIYYTAAGSTGSNEPQVGSNAFDGRPIADGSAVGYLTGRVLTANRAGAPVISVVASPAAAGLTLTTFATGDQLAPRFSTSQGCPSMSTLTAYLGHYCFAHGPANGPGNATQQATTMGLPASYSYHVNSWAEEFVVTDSTFGVVLANSTSPVNVEIDGVPIQAAPTISSGSYDWTLVFDYRGESKRRTVRVVSAAGSVDPALRGVALTANGRVEPAPVTKDQLLILGDSINATVVPPSEAGGQMMTYWLERYLGFGASLNLAVGGSGYVAHNDRTFNVADLLGNPANQALLAGYSGNITHVVVNAGFNDRFLPIASIQAAALATWQALRRLLPNAHISITDGWSGSSGPDAAALALAAALTQTFAQWGDQNSRLIHSVGGSRDTAYINGLGNAGAPIVPGNSSYFTSVDQVHPTPAGARYIARRLADDIAAAWAGGY